MGMKTRNFHKEWSDQALKRRKSDTGVVGDAEQDITCPLRYGWTDFDSADRDGCRWNYALQMPDSVASCRISKSPSEIRPERTFLALLALHLGIPPMLRNAFYALTNTFKYL